MAQQEDHRGRSEIRIGDPASRRVAFLIHGYSGSPTDFGRFPAALAAALDAYVVIPLLPGHGTRVEDLIGRTFDELYGAVRDAYGALDTKGKEVIIGGHSFGGQLAALLAAEVQPAALFSTVAPYRLRPPFSLPLMTLIARCKSLWKKHIPVDEMQERSNAFFYAWMPGSGLSLVKEASRRMRAALPKISCGSLSIHAVDDRLAYPESGRMMLSLTKSEKLVNVVMHEGRHSIFFGSSYDEVESIILGFLKEVLPQS